MKRTIALLLPIMLILMLCACSSAPKGAAEAGLQDAPAEALLTAPDLTYDNDLEAFAGMLNGMYAQGEYFEELGLYRQAAYMYDAGSAAAGSLRLCTECVLFLKGEGSSLEDVSGSALSDWDDLARLSPVSPYPDYFEGLVYQMQGNVQKAKEYFTRALTFPSWPEAGWDFTYLKMLDTDELYALRGALLESEAAFRKRSAPELIAVPRDVYNFSAEYLIALAGEAVESGNFALASAYAAAAVRADPFSGDAFAAAALTSMATGDTGAAADYINDGLYIAPAHEGLNALLTAFTEEG